MDLNLAGKSVLITGATKGIGLAVAERFAQEGCELHLVARSQTDLDEAAESIHRRFGSKVHTHPRDLALENGARSLVDEIGAVDILVNNAGAVPMGDLLSVDDHAWRAAWDLKVYGYINMCRFMYPLMKLRGTGAIVLVAGIAGERPVPAYIAGTAANAALMSFGRALGGYSLSDGIRVVTVNPGAVMTPRFEQFLRLKAREKYSDENRWEEVLATLGLPGGRAAKAQEVADVVAFVASSRAGYISGTSIAIDGGLSGNNKML